MLKWALIFLVISIVAGFFGFSGISAATATIARVLFGIFLVVFLIFLILALMAGQAIFLQPSPSERLRYSTAISQGCSPLTCRFTRPPRDIDPAPATARTNMPPAIARSFSKCSSSFWFESSV